MPQQAPGHGDQCIYCQLIDNPDQLMTVGETDNFYAWLEVNPRARGQTQIVPKEHVESVLELSTSEYREAMMLVREVVERATEGLGADGVSVTMNVKEAAGQMLPHAYISVFPRFQDEENAGTPTGAIFPQQEGLQQELPDIQEEMKSVSVNLEEETHEPHPESKRHKESSSSSSGGSRLVDRQEMENESSGEEEASESTSTEDSEEPDETNESQEQQQPDRKEDKEETEPEGKGHWDGKSFEWR